MSAFERAWNRLRRDLREGVSPSMLAFKGARWAAGLVTAKLALREVDEVGEGVRCRGWPRIENHGHISIGDNVELISLNMVPVELATSPGGRLRLGNGTLLNYGVSIGCSGSVTVGERGLIGPYAMIIDSDFHDLHDRMKRPPPRPVVLEDDVWIGAKAVVMPGVTIGRASVVGAGSVVTHDVPPFTVVAGVPAKVVKKIDPEKFVPAR
ncbi:MAG: acyltransferase [Myxococcota bacterium]